MHDEELEDVITLTRKQWEDLMRSIQSLSQSNATLLKTISYLLKQSAQVETDPKSAKRDSLGQDPYDLAELRRLIQSSE
jgi:hypothetical protein